MIRWVSVLLLLLLNVSLVWGLRIPINIPINILTRNGRSNFNSNFSACNGKVERTAAHSHRHSSTRLHDAATITSTSTGTAVFSAAELAIVAAIEADQFALDLDRVGLTLCHGVLHASGCRRLSDLRLLTPDQLTVMGVDAFDRPAIQRAVNGLGDDIGIDGDISTRIDGAFDKKARGRFDPAPPGQDFEWEVICAENNIFKGRLFSVDQCGQLNRMSEYHAYKGVGTIGAGWTNEIYTLTAQHMACRSVPGFLKSTDDIFRQLLRELYDLYPQQLRRGSIAFETEGEPHLVKYSGKAKGTQLHTDTDDEVAAKSITINALLSPEPDFQGGGTYVSAIDRTILLEQGEMIIHLGNLEHAGVEITSGVRRLLVAFLACEWEPDAAAIAKK